MLGLRVNHFPCNGQTDQRQQSSFGGCAESDSLSTASARRPRDSRQDVGATLHAAPSKCASISSSVLPLVSGKNHVAVMK